MPDHPPQFAISLTPDSHLCLQRLLGALAERLGRLPDSEGARYADGPDLVGAALVVAEREPDVFDAISSEIRRTMIRRGLRGELLAICDELDRISLRLDHPETRQQAQRLIWTLREIAVAVAEQDEPVTTARRLRRAAHHLAALARDTGPWSEPLQDLASSLEDLHDALHPTGHRGEGSSEGGSAPPDLD